MPTINNGNLQFFLKKVKINIVSNTKVKYPRNKISHLKFNKKEVFFAPALPLEEVFDPTGAGDSFAGGFIGYLEKTNDTSFENMKRAVIHGSVMASFCVEKFGTQKLEELTENDVKVRIQEFINLVQFDILLI